MLFHEVECSLRSLSMILLLLGMYNSDQSQFLEVEKQNQEYEQQLVALLLLRLAVPDKNICMCESKCFILRYFN